MQYKGGCFCGAVRYVADGVPINERVCHCRMCQKVIGAAFNARLLFRAQDVSMEGPVGTFQSSADLKRGFCQHCGTTVSSARESAGVMGLTAGSLDNPALFHPDMHFWTADRQLWLKFDDGLPHHPGGPPA